MKERNIPAIAEEFKREAVVPFWMWNDKLEREKLSEQLLEIKERGMNQVIIHPRFGLETPYLSNGWFEMVGFVIDEAEKNDMKLWVYDELNWPSGYAGGEVLKQNPGLRAKHLVKTDDGYATRDTSWKPAYSDDHYIDVLNPEATDVFIEHVYEEYWKRFGKHFGTTILGFFTDEPGMYNNFAGSDPNSIPWTEGLPEFFKEKNGYGIEQTINLIFETKGQESIQARVDYWRTISILYQESYFKRLQEWCHKRDILFIGHVLVEESMVDTAKTQGNFFTTMEHLDFAGYDLLGRLEPKALIAAKLASSAAKASNLYGVTAETFGIFGWDLTEEEMKRVVQWQAEQGLDVLIPHAFYYSLRGDRHNDCPPSFMSDKFWPTFDEFVKFSRDELIDKREDQANAAIYYPIETVWGYLSPSDSMEAASVDHAFQTSSYACYNIGAKFDYIPAQFVFDSKLSDYKFLILPKTEVLSLEVLKKFANFVKKGGKIVCVGGVPRYATEVPQQQDFVRLWEEISPSVVSIDIPALNSSEISLKWTKTNIKNLLQQKVPPIWLARGVRVAKMFGYKRPVRVNQITGIEQQLKSILD